MNSDIRMICLDIDGTLLDSHHRIPAENRSALREAAQKGIRICLLSARPPEAVLPLCDALGLHMPIACFSGALILLDGKTIFDCRIPLQETRKVIDCAEAQKVHLSFYRGFDWVTEGPDSWAEQEAAITGVSPRYLPLKTVLEDGRGCPHKLMCMGEPSEIDAVRSRLAKEHLTVNISCSKKTYLEIIPDNTDKRTAMEFLCTLFSVSTAQVLAVGDQENDLEMLQTAGWGVAMGNATEKVKSIARFVTKSNDEAGVAAVLRRLIH